MHKVSQVISEVTTLAHIWCATDIPTICSLYRQSHVTAHVSSHITIDDKLNTALDS